MWGFMTTLRTIEAAAVSLALCGLALADTSASAPVKFSIEAQPLEDALNQFAKQTGYQVLFQSDMVTKQTAPRLDGELTAEDALKVLLGKSGLKFKFVNERTVSITEGNETVANQAGEAPIRLAQAGAAGEPDAAQEEQLDEIVVTGTHIRGVYPASSPVETYTAEDIARSGATTTEQFIQKLPQNLGTRTQYAANATSTISPEGTNSIDLRGLGVGTTLVLLNGRRLAHANFGQAVDISLIPMSAVERVEVLTDGASAIYGSDAVGGVVNFVLRQDFSGAETRLQYGGVTDGGLDQKNFTQMVGGRWGSGHALASYDFFSAHPLEVEDRSYAAAAGPGTLSPRDKRHSALATITQDFSDRLSANADLAFARRDVENETSFLTSPFQSFSTNRSETRQYLANLNTRYEIKDSLQGSLLANYSKIDVDSGNVTIFPDFDVTTQSAADTDHAALDLTAMLDGSLFALPGGKARFSFGVGYLDEKYKGLATSSGLLSGRDLGRSTSYAFGEVFAPLIDSSQGIPGVYRLELSLAARYTSYDDTSDPPLGKEFGSRTSPKIGVLWAPIATLNIRGTYGESFRAPNLTEIDTSTSENGLLGFPVAGQPATVLVVNGPAPQLDPETAQSYTFGFDFRPAQRPDFHVGATYFNIDYEDRIAVGDDTGGIGPSEDPASFPDVIFPASSAEQIAELLRSTTNNFNDTGIDLSDPQAAAQTLAALPDFWIIDLRLRNLSLSKLDGLDVSIGDRFSTSWGEVSLGGQLTRIFDYQKQVSPRSAVLTVVDTVLLPVDLRGRVFGTLTHGGFTNTVSVNYVDDYTNPFAEGGPQGIDSWTTVDWSAAYGFERGGNSILDGVRLSLSVQNLFDEDPPFVAFSNGNEGLRNPVGFDPANANPLGRLVTVGLQKTW